MYSNIIAWLIACPLVATPFVYLVGRFAVRLGSPRVGSIVSRGAGLLALAITWVPYVLAVQLFLENGSVSYHVGVPLHLDGIGLLIAGLALTLGTLVAFFSGTYMAGEQSEEKYYALLTGLVGAMIGLAVAADLFNLWVWFEAMALASYFMVSFYKEEKASLEAGVKYLVQSASGSALILLGIALVFMVTGSMNMADISFAASDNRVLLVAGALFVIGFGIKAALVPLHTWLPDAYAQAPSGTSAVLSGVVTEVGLLAMLRAIGALTAVTPSWGIILMAFGALNMLVGNLLALRQKQIKRLLAISSITHVGYIILGIGIAVGFDELAGASGGAFHIISHGLLKGLAFMAVGALVYALRLGKTGNHEALTVDDVAGAAKRYPLAALGLSLGVLGLGGLPPLIGFMSKWQIFLAGLATHNQAVLYLIIFAGLNSILSLGYYAPIVNAVYRQQPSAAVQNGKAVPLTMQIPMFLLVLAVIAVGLWPNLLLWMTQPAGKAILATFGG